MIRQKLIPAILALLVLSAMLISDYGHMVFELEKVAERVEIENEELEEDSEIKIKHWFKLLSSSGPSSNEESDHIRIILAVFSKKWHGIQYTFQEANVPLFIQYCSLKIHLS